MMQTHISLLASLDKDYRKHLLQRSDIAGLRQLALHGGALLLSGSLIAWQVPFWPLLLLPHGILLLFGFCAMHETVHRTAFRTGWLNDIVATVVGFTLLMPAQWFRYFHFAHHRDTNDPVRDPELETPHPANRRQYLIHLSGLPIWWSRFVKLAEIASGKTLDSFIPAHRASRVRLETACYLAGYAALFASSLLLQSDLLIWLWLVPAILGQPFLRAYLLAEHTGCPQVSNMLLNSRTTITNGLVRWLAWNMPYHVEHHAFPAVPFHKLAAFHNDTRAHIGTLQTGYVDFHRQLFRTLKRSPPQ